MSGEYQLQENSLNIQNFNEQEQVINIIETFMIKHASGIKHIMMNLWTKLMGGKKNMIKRWMKVNKQR